MARKVDLRIKVCGDLVAEAPVHVGGLGGDADVDLALAVDGAGDFYIPGTSFAGALRTWLGRSASGAGGSLWGHQDGDSGSASHVFVADGKVSSRSLPIEIREGVGIDRVSGTAADRVKYNRAVLPRGSVISFEVQADVPANLAGEAHAQVARLVAALREGRVRLGAARTRGLGKVRLRGERAWTWDLSTPAGILAMVRQEGGFDFQPATAAPADDRMVRVAIRWQPAGPLMVKADRDGFAVDSLPQVAVAGDGLLGLVLPGSGVKGAFRAQAERIVRTLLGIEAQRTGKPEERFLKQVKVPLVTEIFGAAGEAELASVEPESGVDLDRQAARGQILAGLGALAVPDCYSGKTFPEAAWRAVETATTREALRAALAHETLAAMGLQQAHHVAIDRWTGGAAEGLLFSVLEPRDVEWETLQIDLDLNRLNPELQAPAAALLLLLVGDLAAGRVTLGHGGNRGMGEVQVDACLIEGLDRVAPGLGERLEWMRSEEFPRVALDVLREPWAAWINTARDVGRAGEKLAGDAREAR